MKLNITLIDERQDGIIKFTPVEFEVTKNDILDLTYWHDDKYDRDPEEVVDDMMCDLVIGCLEESQTDYDNWDYPDKSMQDFFDWAINTVKEIQTEKRFKFYKDFPRDNDMEYTHDDEIYVYYRIRKDAM